MCLGGMVTDGQRDYVNTEKSAEGSWVGTGFAFIAVGALLAFAFTGEVLGLGVDVVGWSFMAVGVVVVAAAVVRRLRRSE